MDRTILETYVNHGVKAGTMIFFPNGVFDTASVSVDGLSDGAAEVDIEVRALRSGWTGV
jgi:hypothetical protein